ncbi:MAG: glycosyl transferase [Candidatus Parcubacteria bacterium]|nr:MAG: glycosyl transferase [Candidatus Pacearchaeota archaeon]GIW65356.1 MAG: glycosyl transferase [Candidatus Parcubacteria bacterium]
MKKLKILFIGRFPPPVHGASLVNESYFKSKIINQKFQTDKVNLSYSKNLEEIGKFNLRKFFSIPITKLKILKKIIFFKPDLIYFEIAPVGFAFLRDSIYVLILKLFRKRIIFQIHARGINKVVKNKLLKEYYKFVFKNTKMILLSKILYGEIKKIIPKENVYILPNGIKDELNEKKFDVIISKRNKNKKPILLFLSNMIEEKGALDVLKICNELKKRRINFECLFVGSWQNKLFEKKWKYFLKKYELEKKCKYLGPKYGKEKEKILKKTSFLIFPTTYKNESFPLVILEAFMFGIPVLSYNNGAIKEIISKDYLGKVVKKEHWEQLTEELEKRLKKLPTKGSMKKIRQHFKRHYTLEIAEKNLLRIFENELK